MGLISVVPVMSVMNSFMNDVFEKIATESSAPAHQNGVRVELWVHTASGPLTVYYPACIDEIPHRFGLDTVLDLATRCCPCRLVLSYSTATHSVVPSGNVHVLLVMHAPPTGSCFFYM